MWRAFFLLYSIVAKYSDSHEEAVETMRIKVNALIRRHNEALKRAKEYEMPYLEALDVSEYLTNLEIDILSGFNPGKYYDEVPEGDIDFDRAFV